jgi:HEAT repeat protein
MALVEQMKNRDFTNRPGEEVEAMFLALISLAKERAVPIISKLSRRRFLHATPVAVRLAAVSALGALPSPAARKFLDETARSGEESVRLATKKALMRQGP